MAEAGLFVGWGATVRGREGRSLGVFNEAIEFFGGLRQERRIDSFETVLLEPHGGDLAGFFLLRGSASQLAGLRTDIEFQRLMMRAGLVVDRLGVVGAHLGDGLGRAVGLFEEQVSRLG